MAFEILKELFDNALGVDAARVIDDFYASAYTDELARVECLNAIGTRLIPYQYPARLWGRTLLIRYPQRYLEPGKMGDAGYEKS